MQQDQSGQRKFRAAQCREEAPVTADGLGSAIMHQNNSEICETSSQQQRSLRHKHRTATSPLTCGPPHSSHHGARAHLSVCGSSCARSRLDAHEHMGARRAAMGRAPVKARVWTTGASMSLAPCPHGDGGCIAGTTTAHAGLVLHNALNLPPRSCAARMPHRHEHEWCGGREMESGGT